MALVLVMGIKCNAAASHKNVNSVDEFFFLFLFL